MVILNDKELNKIIKGMIDVILYFILNTELKLLITKHICHGNRSNI